MKLLVAVTGCEARKDRMEAQRSTWAKDFRGLADVRFFLARQDRPALPDEVFIDAPDTYEGLPAKSRELSRWALREGYDYLLKTDDDSVIFAKRFSVPRPGVEYSGWVHRPPEENWCSGLAYWLSAKAMAVVAEAPLTILNCEDRWTGYALKKAGIRVVNDPGVLFINKHQRPLPSDIYRRCAEGYAVGEFTPQEIPFIYTYA